MRGKGQSRWGGWTPPAPPTSLRIVSDPICPLCLRPIPPGVPQSRHHLIPKLRGGKGGETVLLHQVCHSTIHRTLSETELARNYATVEALRAHEGLRRFFDWVGKRPPEWKGKVR